MTDLVITRRRTALTFLRRVLQARQRRLAGQRCAFLSPRGQLAHHRADHGIVPQVVVIDEVLVAKRDAEYALADHRARGVLDQTLVAPIAEAGGKTADDADRGVRLGQQQHAGVRGERAAAEISHNCAVLDPSEIERIPSTVCRHRGASFPQLKSFSQNNFR